MYTAEAFPNAFHLFHQAFATSDPVPSLLHLLKEHPTYDVVRDMLYYYIDAVEEKPLSGEHLTSALVRVGQSLDAPLIGTAPLRGIIANEVKDTYFMYAHLGDIDECVPKNPYLFDSLLSGLALRCNLTAHPGQMGAILHGLHSDCREAFLIGTCIQLLLCGRAVVDERAGPAGIRSMKPETIAKKLKAQKKARIVKSTNGRHVLDLAIWHAENGLLPENDRPDVWALLFPSSSSEA
ncbi:hypothetical protein CPB83DRAFT_904567 [Crepidotus variabilis]|uniref:Uncharacterized protein n=1 Tax=Crepidotus variabilis TaxID=179855 RepID=A0A9P6ELW0_9AGAR|nr:hypothetical protein CPB83DRAFT_904567 [Crepidotus variabilis]